MSCLMARVLLIGKMQTCRREVALACRSIGVGQQTIDVILDAGRDDH